MLMYRQKQKRAKYVNILMLFCVFVQKEYKVYEVQKREAES
jgi:hypothetical protein